MRSQSQPGRRQAAQVGAAAVIVAILAVVVILPRVYSTGEPAAPSGTSVAGAVQDPSSSPGAAGSEAASVMPASSSACQTVISEPLTLQPSVKDWSAHSDAVVSGSIVAVSAGRFGTADGSRPTKNPEATDVYRVVTVAVTGVGKTDASSVAKAVAGGQVRVRIFGGMVGCSTYILSGQPDASVGLSAIWFLTSKSQPSLTAAPAADFDVVDNWPITNGSVVLPDGSQMSPSALLSTSRVP